MTLLFMDGFDHYESSDILSKWTLNGGAGSWSTLIQTGGRNGNCLRCYSTSTVWIHKSLGSSEDTFVAGFAFNTTDVNGSRFCDWYSGDGATQEMSLRTTSNYIQLYRGGTYIATGTIELAQSSWYYIEFKVYSNNSSGRAIVKVNGVVDIDYTGDTQVSATPTNFGFYATPYNYNYFDDVYILDDAGSSNNNFLGDVKVETIYPTGAGNETDWTPSTGSNWENVDESTPDDDTTYNYVGSGGGLPANDLYTLGDLTTTFGNVYGVQINSLVRKDDAGSVVLSNILRTGGTTYSGLGTESITDQYQIYSSLSEENPDTATAWTITEVNSLETGIRRVS